MSTPEFRPFPKIGRWANNKIAVTEKIDGTNGVIDVRIEQPGVDDAALGAWTLEEAAALGLPPDRTAEYPAGSLVVLRAGSRNRWLTRGSDNFGFAEWVQENREALLLLGLGTHYGEWWGHGIQRGYALDAEAHEKYFSLFNTGRWVGTPLGVYDKGNPDSGKAPIRVFGLDVVPVLYYGPLRDAGGRCMIEESMRRLQFGGSVAAPGFKNPEGVMVYFEALKSYCKAPFDPLPKGQG